MVVASRLLPPKVPTTTRLPCRRRRRALLAEFGGAGLAVRRNIGRRGRRREEGSKHHAPRSRSVRNVLSSALCVAERQCAGFATQSVGWLRSRSVGTEPKVTNPGNFRHTPDSSASYYCRSCRPSGPCVAASRRRVGHRRAFLESICRRCGECRHLPTSAWIIVRAVACVGHVGRVHEHAVVSRLEPLRRSPSFSSPSRRTGSCTRHESPAGFAQIGSASSAYVAAVFQCVRVRLVADRDHAENMARRRRWPWSAPRVGLQRVIRSHMANLMMLLGSW